jgi:hypothetical protein
MRRHSRVPGKVGRQYTMSGQLGSVRISRIWTDHISRQHVYRCHILPIICPGCSQSFESSRMFAHHIHVELHCDRSLSEADESIRGLETLIQKIRSPTVATSHPSEEDMWKALYTTMFPKDSKDDIPSPCECSPPPSFQHRDLPISS